MNFGQLPVVFAGVLIEFLQKIYEKEKMQEERHLYVCTEIALTPIILYPHGASNVTNS